MKIRKLFNTTHSYPSITLMLGVFLFSSAPCAHAKNPFFKICEKLLTMVSTELKERTFIDPLAEPFVYAPKEREQRYLTDNSPNVFILHKPFFTWKRLGLRYVIYEKTSGVVFFIRSGKFIFKLSKYVWDMPNEISLTEELVQEAQKTLVPTEDQDSEYRFYRIGTSYDTLSKIFKNYVEPRLLWQLDNNIKRNFTFQHNVQVAFRNQLYKVRTVNTPEDAAHKLLLTPLKPSSEHRIEIHISNGVFLIHTYLLSNQAATSFWIRRTALDFFYDEGSVPNGRLKDNFLQLLLDSIPPDLTRANP